MDYMEKMDESTREVINQYQERMRQEGRCVQCINPWYDGICECHKDGPEQAEIANLVYKYIL